MLALERVGITSTATLTFIYAKIDKYTYYQPISRLINKQSRKITINYLDLLFNKYNILIDCLIKDNDKYIYLYKIITKFKKLNNKLILSLEKLNITYDDFYIDKCINKYIDILLKLNKF